MGIKLFILSIFVFLISLESFAKEINHNNFSITTKSLLKNYKIIYGDTLFEILEKSFNYHNPSEIVPLLQELNPSLVDINFILEGAELKIPTPEYISNKNLKIKRNPSFFKSHLKNKKYQTIFKTSFLLEEEIYYLKNEAAMKYIIIFKQIVNAQTKNEILEYLKRAQNESRNQNSTQIKNAINQLVKITEDEKSKTDNYLLDLTHFFNTWNILRKQKVRNAKRSE